MKFTKLEHSGCIIEDNGKKVICDPVEIEEKLPDLKNVAVIIITHKHGDHFQPKALEKIIARSPNVRIFAPQDFEIAEIFEHQIEKVIAGAEWDIEGFNLKFFSKDHASIIPSQIPCANIGVVVNSRIVNPGDSFDIPDDLQNPELLMVPSEAPWIKSYGSMDYIRNIQPKNAVPVHNAVLSKFGNGINNNWLKIACEEVGTRLAVLEVEESIEI